MEPPVLSLVEQIHAHRHQFVLAVTGGGSGAIAALLRVPGGSRTLLEAVVPYSARAMARFLGGEPEHYCAPATACAMAATAQQRALDLRTERDVAVLGVACTAALATDRPKRGAHRCHVAVQDERAVATYSLTLAKGARSRGEEEDVATRLILTALVETFGPPLRMELGAGDELIVSRTTAPEPLRLLVARETARVTVAPSGRFLLDAAVPPAVLAGSFHPLHEGHRRLAAVAAEMLRRPVSLEISITNVDKPILDYSEVLKRVRQFRGSFAVELTRAPTFVEKSRVLPGTTFVVGADTALRIVEPRYYGGDAAAMRRALGEIAEHGCRFLVAGRASGTGGGAARFVTLGDVPVPDEFRGLFEAIDESRFRLDISSTEIRAREGAGGEAAARDDAG